MFSRRGGQFAAAMHGQGEIWDKTEHNRLGLIPALPPQKMQVDNFLYLHEVLIDIRVNAPRTQWLHWIRYWLKDDSSSSCIASRLQRILPNYILCTDPWHTWFGWLGREHISQEKKGFFAHNACYRCTLDPSRSTGAGKSTVLYRLWQMSFDLFRVLQTGKKTWVVPTTKHPGEKLIFSQR